MTFPEERTAITNLLRTIPGPVCIVELGAHEGEDTAWVLDAIASTQRVPYAVLVEADPVNFKILEHSYSPANCRYPCELVYGAIAAHDGTCEFNANRSTGGGYGSIYAPNHSALGVDSTKWEKIESIPCFTFDTLFREQHLDHIDLLWVDIHGAEKDMIQFGQEALQHTRYLFVEAVDWWNGNSPVRMYEGAATSSEIQAMLPGWKLLQTFPWNLLLKNENYV
jgi:2-O-methyltransferase